MFKFSRLVIAYAIAVPLALLLGYLVVSPGNFTFAVIGMLLFFMAFPLFLKWHHILLIVFWNSVFDVGLLPGQPQLWVLLAFLSFGISFLNHIVFQRKFLSAPELTKPLLFLSAVVLFTAWYRGGIGIRALGGSSYGGRYYVFILAAIVGYFAFTAEPISIARSGKMAGWFFGSGTTAVLSNVVYTLGPAFYFLYYLVPSADAQMQAAADFGLTNIDRISSLEPTCIAAVCCLLARYGIRGIFDLTYPWRLAFFCIAFGASFFSGFRTGIMILMLIFACQFYLEGLLRSHYLPIVLGLAICGMAPVLFFTRSMPTSVQRAISFLPVTVDSEVLEDARNSSEWRFEMWRIVVKEIPKYWWIGKGYGIDPNELAVVSTAAQTGVQLPPYEGQLIAGDYHSGPLSLIMPFGIFGVIGFLWVLVGGYQVLSRNYRYGDPRLRRINTTFLAYYVSYCFSFFFIFGAFNNQMPIFLGVCGLSVSLNGGVRRKAAVKARLIPIRKTLAMEAR